MSFNFALPSAELCTLLILNRNFSCKGERRGSLDILKSVCIWWCSTRNTAETTVLIFLVQPRPDQNKHIFLLVPAVLFIHVDCFFIKFIGHNLETHTPVFIRAHNSHCMTEHNIKPVSLKNSLWTLDCGKAQTKARPQKHI